MILSGPCADARSRPRSWARNSGAAELRQAQPDRAQPERRVGLLEVRGLEERRELVGAEIERADRRRPAAEPSQHRDRGLVVALLVGQLGLAHEQVLGAEQPDAHRAVVERVVELVGAVDVAVQLDVDAVERARRQIAHRVQRGAGRDLAALLVAELGDRRRASG